MLARFGAELVILLWPSFLKVLLSFALLALSFGIKEKCKRTIVGAKVSCYVMIILSTVPAVWGIYNLLSGGQSEASLVILVSSFPHMVVIIGLFVTCLINLRDKIQPVGR